MMYPRIFQIVILFLMLISYSLARFLPIQAGWENGVVENTQVAILLLGCITAIHFALRAKKPQWRWFALMVALVWIILVGRELSWGAALIMPPIYLHPETAPVYSSTQLSARTLIHIIAALLLFLSVLIFFITKQYRSIQQIYKTKAFPWVELALALIAAMLCTTAEGHGFYEFKSLSEAQLQTLEELFELCSYLAIFAGQIFVWQKVKSNIPR